MFEFIWIIPERLSVSFKYNVGDVPLRTNLFDVINKSLPTERVPIVLILPALLIANELTGAACDNLNASTNGPDPPP